MLNAYQMRLKYKNKYRIKVASFLLTPCSAIFIALNDNIRLFFIFDPFCTASKLNTPLCIVASLPHYPQKEWYYETGFKQLSKTSDFSQLFAMYFKTSLKTPNKNVTIL